MSDQAVVTIMHTDVADSTALTVRVGDEAARGVIHESKLIVREQVEAGGGREIDAVGDSTMSTFTSPRQAIGAAIAIQRAIDERERAEPGSTVLVRVGINIGEVLERDGRPFGAAVNAGARVMAKADGGEIVVSEMVRQLAGSVPGVEFRDRGRHSFKGWEERWRLYEVIWRSPSEAPPPRPAKSTRRRLGRRAVLVAALIAVMAVGAVVAVLLLRGGGGSAGLPRIDRQSVGLLDPENGKILKEVPVGTKPIAITVGAGSVWVANEGNQTVTRIDPSTLKTETITLRGHPTDVTVAGEAVWAATLEGGLIRIDPQFNSAAEPVAVHSRGSPVNLPGGLPEVVAAGVALWVSAPNTTLVRFSTAGGGQRHTVAPDTGASGPLAAGAGTLWTASTEFVAPLDPVTGIGSGALIKLSGTVVALAYGAGAVWSANTSSNVLQRIDAATRAVTSTTPVGRNPTGVAVGGRAVWVTSESDGSVTRLDLRTGKAKTIRVGGSPTSVEVSNEGVWVASE
jgi:YVTN family beta-propeller protein